MKSNIVLIGFMGAGKTAIGKVLAKSLNWNFIELDSLIEQRAGKSITKIFEHDGEIAFRKLEIEVTEEVYLSTDRANMVIACGGGIVLNQINIDRLKEKSRIIYLAASSAVILKRILGDGQKRPLLAIANSVLTIHELLNYRKPFYERAADIEINTSRLSINAVVKQIVKRMKQDESFNS